MASAQVEKLMKNLGISEEEALQVLADDKAIDKGEKLFELSEEQKKVAKKMTNFDSKNRKKPIVVGSKPANSRTKNATKGGIIAELATFLTENSQFSIENLEILNTERQISFKIGDETYEITLAQKRKPKK